MDTNVLKTFISVCEYSGFSAAAKKLGYTQSTVSSQIRQLERELDTVLFDRFYHKIVLTEDGVTALKYARNILESQKKMIEEIKQPERIEGTDADAEGRRVRRPLARVWRRASCLAGADV